MSCKSRLCLFILIILLCIIFCINIASATITKIEYRCFDNDCTEGNIVNWSITIHNKGSGFLDMNTIMLVNPETGAILVSKTFTNNVTVSRDEIETFVVEDVLPAPNYLDVKLRYKPCIITNVGLNWRHLYGTTMKDCNYDIYEMPDRPLLYRDCDFNTECNSDEICKDNKCVRFRCEYCQHVANHMCVSYECCKSDECWENERCVNNGCVKLACTDDEFISNHSCAKLNCTESEFAYNHECITLLCLETEQAANHKCAELDCDDDELIYNHTCVKFTCPFLRSPRKHVCVINRFLVYFIVIVLLIFIGGRITAFIINKKQEIKRYKKSVQPCPNCGTMLKPYATVCPACRYDLKKAKKKKKK